MGILFLFAALVASIPFLPLVWLGYSRGKKRLGRLGAFGVTVSLCVTTLAPYLLPGLLYFASWRAQARTGEWPRWMGNDSEATCASDALCRTALDSADLAQTALLLWTPAWLCLMALLRNTHGHFTRRLFIAAFCLGWLLLCVDPGGRITWWID